MSLCFDKYISSFSDISEKTCKDFGIDKKFPEKNGTYMDIWYTDVDPKSGCCNSPDKSDVNIINSQDELLKYIEDLKKRYIKLWTGKINLDETVNTLLIENHSKLLKSLTKIKKVDIEEIKKDFQRLKRLFLEADINLEKIYKKYNFSKKEGFDNMLSEAQEEDLIKSNSAPGESEENIKRNFLNLYKEKVKENREKVEKSEEHKVQYFDKAAYSLYQNSFYIMLITISILFIKKQVSI